MLQHTSAILLAMCTTLIMSVLMALARDFSTSNQQVFVWVVAFLATSATAVIVIKTDRPDSLIFRFIECARRSLAFLLLTSSPLLVALTTTSWVLRILIAVSLSVWGVVALSNDRMDRVCSSQNTNLPNAAPSGVANSDFVQLPL